MVMMQVEKGILYCWHAVFFLWSSYILKVLFANILKFIQFPFTPILVKMDDRSLFRYNKDLEKGSDQQDQLIVALYIHTLSVYPPVHK